MNLVVYFLFLFVIANSSSRSLRNRRQDKKCEDCILLRDCHSYLERLRNNDPDVKEQIKKNRCGREGFRLKVCCLEDKSKQADYFPDNCGINIAGNKIVNGNETEMGEFPWIAALEYKMKDETYSTIMCSGSLINARYVLTAAHCLDPKKLNGNELYKIRLGEWNLTSNPDCVQYKSEQICAPKYISAKPETIISHKMYDMEHANAHDIALIRLDQTIDYDASQGHILPICLPSFGIRTELLRSYKDPIVVGWGKTKFTEQSQILLKADVPFAEKSMCTKYFYNAFGDKQLCVGGTLRDSCNGDSGSPLMLSGPDGSPYLQIGIVSFGTLICGSPNVPAVYTSVSHYKIWIMNNMEPW